MRLPLLLLLLLALGLLPAPAGADLKAGQAALQKGEWAAAEKEFTSTPAAEAGEAQLGLAELWLLTGRYAEALAAAQKAIAVPATKSDGLRMGGEAHRRMGKLAEAKAALTAALQANPRNTRARAELGRLQRQAGQPQAVEQTLQPFLDDFANGVFEKAGAAAYTDLAIACRVLKMWQDANDLFRQATEKEPQYLRAQLEWGDLFLEKHKPTEARKSYDLVLKTNPNHPLALVGMARAALTGQYNVRAANEFADKALAQNPNQVEALALKADLFLDNEEFGPAEKLLQQALKVNPADLEAQALFAASRYLQDDTPGYEQLRAAVLKQNPRCGDFYLTVSEHAVKQHRYQAAIDLLTKAVAVEPDNPAALLALGTGYLRLVGHDEQGLEALRKAWDLDPFSVMNYNTLTLFEEVIPKQYEVVTSGPFRFRFNKKEKPLLALYVPDLVQRAWESLVKRYGFTPKTPIVVELFTERQHYSVRTVGLPDLGAQGTCFGQLVTAMSPSSGEANWEEVLWHEFSHVFHIQMSKNRVARWFTEGLAEYETNIARPEWKREYNRDLYLSLRRGNLWRIGDLNAAFTRPDRPNGVVLAYHQSSLVIHYLAETFGFEKIAQALRLYGDGKRDDQVIPAMTGKSVAEVDEGFRDWLRKRLAHFEKSFLVDWQLYGDPAKWKAEAEGKPGDAAAQASYAAALFVAKEMAPAKAQAEKALALDARQHLARFVLGQLALDMKDYPAAKQAFAALVAEGVESYTIRMALGQVAAAEGDLEGAQREFNAAKPLDPDRGEPHQLVAELYRKQGKEVEALKEIQAYTRIEEHDHDTARLNFSRLVSAKESAAILESAPRLIAIQPMEPFVHEQYGRALAAAGQHPLALREFDAALAAAPRKPGPIRAAQARSYLALGERARAKAAAEAALKDDPGNEEAVGVLREIG